MTARSRTGYVICYGGFPLIWNSKLQTEIALSSTEAEYIALSEALRQAIVIMNLLKECVQRQLPVNHEETEVKCTAFEDNQGALELAKTPKLTTTDSAHQHQVSSLQTRSRKRHDQGEESRHARATRRRLNQADGRRKLPQTQTRATRMVRDTRRNAQHHRTRFREGVLEY